MPTLTPEQRFDVFDYALDLLIREARIESEAGDPDAALTYARLAQHCEQMLGEAQRELALTAQHHEHHDQHERSHRHDVERVFQHSLLALWRRVRTDRTLTKV